MGKPPEKSADAGHPAGLPICAPFQLLLVRREWTAGCQAHDAGHLHRQPWSRTRQLPTCHLIPACPLTAARWRRCKSPPTGPARAHRPWPAHQPWRRSCPSEPAVIETRWLGLLNAMLETKHTRRKPSLAARPTDWCCALNSCSIRIKQQQLSSLCGSSVINVPACPRALK